MVKVAIEVGEKYFFRSVTMHYLGRVKAIEGDFILIEDASWVADSGRFHTALLTGSLSEVEPYVNDVSININALTDFTKWDHELPRKVIE